MIDPKLLPGILKLLAVLSIIGGIICCVNLWPDKEDYYSKLPQELRDLLPAEASLFTFNPMLYIIPIAFLISGLISSFIFWALGDVVYRVRVLTGMILNSPPKVVEHDTEQE